MELTAMVQVSYLLKKNKNVFINIKQDWIKSLSMKEFGEL